MTHGRAAALRVFKEAEAHCEVRSCFRLLLCARDSGRYLRHARGGDVPCSMDRMVKSLR